jgi:WD40 repeat protein
MHTPLMLGQLLDDRYQVIQSLGTSRYSQVYIAKDVTQPGSPQCKISCFRPVNTDYASMEAAREIFQNEVQKLHHLGSHYDRVPFVLSAFEYNKDFYLIEDAIEGRSLGDELAVGNLLSEVEAISMVIDVLKTLQVAHEEQLIHGDINPSNLIACSREHSSDNPKIILVNFAGLRKICNPLLPMQSVPLLGTPSYMPTEQAQGDEQPSCDLYALGLTTIQALTGKHPSQMEVNAAIGAIAWHDNINISSKLADILDRMVKLNPEERYQSATEVLSDFRRLQPQGVRQIAAIALDGMKRLPQVTVISVAIAVAAGITFFNLGKYVSRLSSGQPTPVAVASPPSSATNPTHSPTKPATTANKPSPQEGDRTRRAKPQLKPFTRSHTPVVVGSKGNLAYNAVASSPRSRSITTATTTATTAATASLNPVANLPVLNPRYTLMGHEDAVVAVSFFPNGHSFASGSADKTVRLWDTSARRAFTVMSNHSGYVSGITAVATSPDGHTFASGSLDRTVKLWNFRSGKPTQLFFGHRDRVLAVAFDPSGQYLVSGSGDRTVKLWDLSIGQTVLTLTGHSDAVVAVAVSPDGRFIASGSEDRTIVLWDMAKGKKIRTLKGHEDTVATLAFSPDGKTLASGSADKTIRLWNIATGRQTRTFSGHTQKITSLAFRVDGNILASGSSDRTIRLWDIKTGASQTLSGHSEAVLSVAFSPKNNTLISGSADKTIIVWR